MKRIALFLIVPAIVLAFVGANLLSKNNVCKDLLIHISNEDEVKFVTATDVKSALLNTNNIKPSITKLKDLNIAQLEAVVSNNPWVKNANVYVDHQDYVNVEIVQKVPILRWMNGDLIQSYLDADANTIPVNPNYGANVPIVTSHNIGATLKEQKMKYEMVALCKFIKQDTFWNASIAQINVTNQLQFELISNLGNHMILFGDTTNMHNKFARLFTFYKEVMPRDGWTKFQELNLKFDGQIVAKVNDSIQVIKETKGILVAVSKPIVNTIHLPNKVTNIIAVNKNTKKIIEKKQAKDKEASKAKQAKQNQKVWIAASTKSTIKNVVKVNTNATKQKQKIKKPKSSEPK